MPTRPHRNFVSKLYGRTRFIVFQKFKNGSKANEVVCENTVIFWPFLSHFCVLTYFFGFDLVALAKTDCLETNSSKGEWSVAERTTFMGYLCNERS